MGRIGVFVTVVACVLGSFGITSLGPAAAATGPAASTEYIVVLKAGQSPANDAAKNGITPTMVYTSALRGYVASLTAQKLAVVQADPAVDYVEANQAVALNEPPSSNSAEPSQQVITNSVKRVGVLQSPTAHVNGKGKGVDADIAILDTGVDGTHPDLDVAGGYNCVNNQSATTDPNGHGTMVAGRAAAIDNKIGVVGVAPGARIWSVRVLKGNGNGSNAEILCGIDWVTAHANVIDVANMSIEEAVQQIDPCGVHPNKRRNAIHDALCASVAAGVTYTVAAGNDAVDATTIEPAGFDEVITVSASTDTDGIPGGLGPAPTCLPTERDDTLATFSNFGPAVDVAAPGVCVTSTFTGDIYGVGTGTSFSAPLVAGAAALLKARNPHWSPAKVKAAILANAEQGPISGDPDNYPEGLLNVAGF